MPYRDEGVNILLVEDTQSDVTLFREGLKGCQVRANLMVARDGEGAMKILFEDHYTPDLIILDLNLPKLDGYQVLQEVKKSPLRQTPVIIFSTTPERMEPPHADAYVRKPTFLEDYLQTVRRICDDWISRVAEPGAER